jgi:hypothetical protein
MTTSIGSPTQEELPTLRVAATRYTSRWVSWEFRLTWLNLLFAAGATILTALAAAGPLQGKTVAAQLPANVRTALGADAGWKAVCWTATTCSALATALMFVHKGLRCTNRISEGASCVAALDRIDPQASAKAMRDQIASLKQKHPEVFF